MNLNEADWNHDKEDQLKNINEEKALRGQQLMDQRIKSVRIALGQIHQTSGEQLVENATGTTRLNIIFEFAQKTRKVG